jgi:N-acyl homoserine lactone hydrolase
VGTALRLYPLDPPTFVVRPSAVVSGSADDRPIRVPIPAFVVEHAHGLLLFDAGLAPEAAADPIAEYGERAQRMELHFTPRHRVDSQIRAAGHRPEDVTHVVLSHLHFDHVGGAHLFPAADVLLGPGELAHAKSGHDNYCRAADVRRVESRRARELDDGDTDLFGDGSVVALTTPGHTPGSLSLLVRLPHRTWLLAGDVVHLRSALTSESPFPHDHDPAAAIASIRRVKAVAEQAQASVWISHDPDDWSQLRPETVGR